MQRVTLSLETALAGLNCVFNAFQIEELFGTYMVFLKF